MCLPFSTTRTSFTCAQPVVVLRVQRLFRCAWLILVDKTPKFGTFSVQVSRSFILTVVQALDKGIGGFVGIGHIFV